MNGLFANAFSQIQGPNYHYYHLKFKSCIILLNLRNLLQFYPPAVEASKEVANLTKRKNPHAPVYGVKEFVCLSVCDPNYGTFGCQSCFCKLIFASKTANL